MADSSVDPKTIGPFLVLRMLGEGAMGVVYAGYDVGLDRKVALKLVRRQLLDKPAVRARMIREAQAMARLSSPYVVQVYQVGEHGDGIYVAMEYIEGESLTAWLGSAKRPWQTILRTLCDAGRGLAAAHAAGLVHRDFKPDNVLVDANGRARVLDFGLVQSETGAGDDDLDRPTSTETDRRPRTLGRTREGPMEATMEDVEPAAPGHPRTGSIERAEHRRPVTNRRNPRLTPLPSEGASQAIPADGGNTEISAIHWSIRLTQLGRAVGTPAYMSPEQHFGDIVGAYSDQYSFAVTLYEALYGARPFNADSWAGLKAQVQTGEVPPPPLGTRVPSRVHKILVQALATDADRRWPSLDAMLAELDRDPRRAQLRFAGVVGLLAAVAGTTYATTRSQTSVELVCAESTRELGGVWDDERRSELARAFTDSRTSFSASVWRRVEPALDAYAAAWTAEHRASCEANLRGGQTTHLTDLRMACLDRHRARLGALVDIFAGADRAVVERAVQAVAALPSVQACANAEELLAVAPPADPRVVAKVEQLRLQLARVRALEDTGRYDVGLVLARKVQNEAEALGYTPLTAETALGEGSMLLAAARPGDAEGPLVQAVRLAITSDMHAIAAEAAAKRVFALGAGIGKHAEALAMEQFTEALVERARDDGRLAALLYNNLGVVWYIHGDEATARRNFQRSIDILERAGGTDPLLGATRHNLGNMEFELGRLDAARDQFVRARDLFIDLVGEQHPLVAHPLSGLGDVAEKSGQYDEAERMYGAACSLMEAAYGPDHPYVQEYLAKLAGVVRRLGRPIEARAYYARVVESAGRLGTSMESLGWALEGLAELDGLDPGVARRWYEQAFTAYEHAGEGAAAARAALRAGELAAAQGEVGEATTWLERSLQAGGDGPTRGAAAIALAQVLAPRGHAARVCELLRSGTATLADGDTRRSAAEALLGTRCQ